MLGCPGLAGRRAPQPACLPPAAPTRALLARPVLQEYFAEAPEEERAAADALMEREFTRLARMSVGAIDDAIKQVRPGMSARTWRARVIAHECACG